MHETVHVCHTMTIIHVYHSVLSMLVLRVACVRVFVLMVEEHGNSGLLQTWSWHTVPPALGCMKHFPPFPQPKKKPWSWVKTALKCVINVSGVKIARPLPSRTCSRVQCHNGVLSGRGGTPSSNQRQVCELCCCQHALFARVPL